MRIAIFTDTYLPDINGVVSSVELLRKELIKLNNTVYIVYPYKGKHIEVDGCMIRLPGVEIKKLYGYAMAQPIHFLFIEELKKLNLDILHAETEFGVGIFANIVAANLNLPLVRTYHTTYEDYTHYLNLLHSKTLDKGLKKIVASISKIYCNNCVKLIAPSNKTANMLKAYGVVSDMTIIPSGIELERFKKANNHSNTINKIRENCGIDHDEKLLIFVGRLAEEKAVDLIIKSFVKVKEQKQAIKLLIVGDGPSKETLIALTAELGLKDYIKFVGKISYESIPLYYQAADAFVSASTSETQGLTYIEALASGLPVIARYDTVLTDLVIDNYNGYFFNNLDELVEKILKFGNLSNNEYQIISKMARESVTIYDSEKFGSSTFALYKEAIEDYQHSFIIEKTNLKNNTVILELKGYDNHKEKLHLSIDIYYNLGFRNNDKLTKLNYTYLKVREAETLAYEACLKKLSIKDYSIKEMRKYLSFNKELKDYQVDSIINHLIEQNLLDDKRYGLSILNSYRNLFLSTNAIKQKMLKAGISKEIIDYCFVNNENDDLSNAYHKGKKYLNSIHNKSIEATKKAIYTKLINDGFDYELVKEVVENLDYQSIIFNQDELLKKEAKKLYNKYAKKYAGSELRNKIYLALVYKGFSYDNIYAIINEMEF